MKALIDGDVIAYRVGFAAETQVIYIYERGEGSSPLAVVNSLKEAEQYIAINEEADLVAEVVTIPDDLSNTLHSVKMQIEYILKQTDATSYQVYLTGEGNYRDDIATIRKYKGNRDRMKKPYYFKEIRDYMVRQWGAEVINGMEADDAMAMKQTDLNVWKDPIGCDLYIYESIICTIDKDLDMIAGWHYNFVKDIKYFVDFDTAEEWFYCQLIMGDVVDNIEGIPGAGKRKAYNVLKDCTNNEERYAAVLELYGGDEGRLEENARLLWMSRYEPNDWKRP